MATKFAYIYADPRYKKARKLVLERDGNECVQCYATDNLQADHIKPLDAMTAEELASGLPYDPDALQTLCNVCNRDKSNKVLVRKTWINRKWFTK